jgi:hypothetical protein
MHIYKEEEHKSLSLPGANASDDTIKSSCF